MLSSTDDGLLGLIQQEKSFSGWVGCHPEANPTAVAAAGAAAQSKPKAAGLTTLADLAGGSLAPAEQALTSASASGAAGAGGSRTAAGAAAAPEPVPTAAAVTDWSAEDPVSAVEAEAAAEGSQPSAADLAMAADGWRQVAEKLAGADVFLNAPVSELGKRGKRKSYFTPKQIE